MTAHPDDKAVARRLCQATGSDWEYGKDFWIALAVELRRLVLAQERAHYKETSEYSMPAGVWLGQRLAELDKEHK